MLDSNDTHLISHLRESFISMIIYSLVLIVFLSYSNLFVSFLILAGSVSIPYIVSDLILSESYSSFRFFTSLSSLLTYDDDILMPLSVYLFSPPDFSIFTSL